MSKEAMKLALDELKHIKQWCLRSIGIGLVNENVLAELEEALAKQDEPVAEVILWRGEKIVQWEQSLPVGTKLYTTPQTKQEQGEPVAWMRNDEFKAMTNVEKQGWIAADEGKAGYWSDLVKDYTIPLYRYPQPKREPMKQDDVARLWMKTKDYYKFARAIEAAHGIVSDEPNGIKE